MLNETPDRFSLLELDDYFGETPKATENTEEDTYALYEIKEENEILARHGVDFDEKPVYDVGEALNGDSVLASRMLADQKERESLPFIQDAVADFNDVIRAEDRQSHVRTFRNGINVSKDGRLAVYNVSKPHTEISAFAPVPVTYEITENTWGQLVQYAPKNALKHNVNSWLGDKTTKCRILTRNTKSGNDREAYGLVSAGGPNSYYQYDAHLMADRLTSLLPADTKCKINYDRQTTNTSITCLTGRHFNVDEISNGVTVGQAFEAGISVKTNDNGNGSYKFRYYVQRGICNNGLIIDLGNKFRVYHRGYLVDNKIARIAEKAVNFFEDFHTLWKDANFKSFADNDGTPLGALDAIKRLVSHKLVQVPNVSNADLVQNIFCAWQKEPQNSVTGVINGITRAAHESTWESKWSQEDLEEQAGSILYQQNYVLRPLTKAMQSEY